MEGNALNEKEIRKDLRELKFEFATLEKPKHSSVVQESAVIEGIEPSKNSKSYGIGLRKSGDCEIRQQTVTIFSDGTYEHRATIHNNGVILGDTMVVKIEFYDHNTFVADFGWTEHLNAGETKPFSTNGREINIKTFWTQITSADCKVFCL